MKSLQKLLDIIQQLRDPVLGCEWDRVQTFASIKPYTLEETYEVLAAIDKEDFDELKKELGDLLFHIVFYADLAKEQNYFNFDDVCQSVVEKLTTRHPHIFGDEIINTPNWELLKQQERDKKQQYSLLDDIPNNMPALMRANKIQKRCASVGFDWQELSPVIAKIEEELSEVMLEVNKTEQDPQKIAEEVGDLLFATVNLARHLKLQPELTLEQANKKFERRFRQVESILKAKNISLAKSSLDEMEEAWQQVKELELEG